MQQPVSCCLSWVVPYTSWGIGGFFRFELFDADCAELSIENEMCHTGRVVANNVAIVSVVGFAIKFICVTAKRDVL